MMMKTLLVVAIVLVVAAVADEEHERHLRTMAKARAFASHPDNGNKLAGVHGRISAKLGEIRQQAQELQAHASRALSARAVSDDCAAATALVWQSVSAEECKVVFDDNNPQNIWKSTSKSELEQTIPAFCESDCRATLLPRFRSMLRTCNRAELRELNVTVETIVHVRLALKLPCFQVNGQYCFPEVTEFETAFANNANPTQESLGQACTTCKRRYVLAMVALHTQDPEAVSGVAALFQILCLRSRPRTGKFCLPEFHAIGEYAKTSPPVADLFKRQCETNCIARLGALARAFNFSGFSGDDFKNTQLFCYRDDNNKLCLVRIFETIDSLKACPSTTCTGCDTETGAGCDNKTAPYCAGDRGADAQQKEGYCDNAMCGGAIDTFMSNTGCCSNLIVALADTQEKRAQLHNWVTKPQPAGCGRTFNTKCVGEKIFVRLVVRNLLSTWVEANLRQLEAAIIADLAANTGIEAEYMSKFTVEGTSASSRSEFELIKPSSWFSARSTGTETTISIELDAPSSREAHEAYLQLSAGEFISPKTSTSVSEDGVANQEDGVTVESKSTSCNSCTSAATNASRLPAFAVAAIAVVAAFFAML